MQNNRNDIKQKSASAPDADSFSFNAEACADSKEQTVKAENATVGDCQTVSVELTEADFAYSQMRTAAIDTLIKKTNGASVDEHGLVRPHISAVRAVLNITLPLIICGGIFCLLYFLLPRYNLTVALSVSLGLLGLYIIVRMRSILIWCVLVYQAKAPAHVRRRCVFTPTCSEYALQALRKYGVIRGVPKIVARLWRCHPPNEGNDPLK